VSARLAAFALGSLALLAVNWAVSIRHGRYHGVFRFFAFEGIWGLILLNYSVWFRDPFAPLQILSWAFLIASIPLAFGGALRILRDGRPDGQFENTTRLATDGLYRFIRHPMYASYMAFALGVFFKDVTPLTTGIIAAVALMTLFTARQEENEMLSRFGAEYAAYMKTTRRFIPGIF
jgi:protein-S-isoprenylcysteine O-methyltransferase Ste14